MHQCMDSLVPHGRIIGSSSTHPQYRDAMIPGREKLAEIKRQFIAQVGKEGARVYC